MTYYAAALFNMVGLAASLSVAFWCCELAMGRAIIVAAWFTVMLLVCAVERAGDKGARP